MDSLKANFWQYGQRKSNGQFSRQDDGNNKKHLVIPKPLSNEDFILTISSTWCITLILLPSPNIFLESSNSIYFNRTLGIRKTVVGVNFREQSF